MKFNSYLEFESYILDHINEALKIDYPIKLNKNGNNIEVIENIDNRKYFIQFMKSGDKQYALMFYYIDDNGIFSTSVMNFGESPQKVFSYVTSSLYQFIRKFKPNLITWNAVNIKRIKVYDKMLKMVMKKIEFTDYKFYDSEEDDEELKLLGLQDTNKKTYYIKRK